MRIELEEYLSLTYNDSLYKNCPNKPEAPKLIDGGAYDNQGAHKLS